MTDTAPTTLLLVDDEPGLREPLADYLSGQGFSVLEAESAAAARTTLGETTPDLVLLDIMMPGEDGLSLCRHLVETRDLPVILLTARSSESDRVEGLDSGADDYITKPFSLKVLMAKIRAWVRRTQGRPGVLRFGDVEADLRKRVLRRDGHEVRLTTHEAAVLSYLIDHKGRAVPREELLEKVWGYSPTMQTRTVDNHIARLRKKLESDVENPIHVVTIHGLGYRFESKLLEEQ